MRVYILYLLLYLLYLRMRVYCKANKFGGINNLGDRPKKWGEKFWGVNNLGDGLDI